MGKKDKCKGGMSEQDAGVGWKRACCCPHPLPQPVPGGVTEVQIPQCCCRCLSRLPIHHAHHLKGPLKVGGGNLTATRGNCAALSWQPPSPLPGPQVSVEKKPWQPAPTPPLPLGYALLNPVLPGRITVTTPPNAPRG